MSNEIIRRAVQEAGVKLWQIADKLGMNDGNFSRMLRKELPEEKQKEILEIIRESQSGGQKHETERF